MDKRDIIAENKRLVELYPFLRPRNVWTGEYDDDYDYSYTELDEMPEGWRDAFGEQMCAEIQKAIKEDDDLEDFMILQIKEKYGHLRFYVSGYNDAIDEIINKYEDLSIRTCIHCGKPATQITTGWISPWCDECIRLVGYPAVPIDEWFKEDLV